MRKDNGRNGRPITAPIGTTPEELRQLMADYRIRQIPLLDAEGRVVDIALESDYLADSSLAWTDSLWRVDLASA